MFERCWPVTSLNILAWKLLVAHFRRDFAHDQRLAARQWEAFLVVVCYHVFPDGKFLTAVGTPVVLVRAMHPGHVFTQLKKIGEQKVIWISKTDNAIRVGQIHLEIRQVKGHQDQGKV